MIRLVALAALLAVATWLARDTEWLQQVTRLVQPASPHEAYRASLERSGLDDTPLGIAWVSASAQALVEPTVVTLPHNRTLEIHTEQPIAVALKANVKRGQRLEAVALLDGELPATVFVDVFEVESELEHAAETDRELETGTLHAAQFEPDDERPLLVRVQPELLRGGQLHLSLRARPALRFPVADATASDLHSVFGDARDAGRRQHEGVDIFARRGTNVLSASDGIVTRVGNGGLGGRVIWIWDVSRGLRFYYAHLDEQLVSTGERVKAGDVIGRVGNTGNARTTPPHLHFGIYERGSGAIDPYWFIAPPERSTLVGAEFLHKVPWTGRTACRPQCDG